MVVARSFKAGHIEDENRRGFVTRGVASYWSCDVCFDCVFFFYFLLCEMVPFYFYIKGFSFFFYNFTGSDPEGPLPFFSVNGTAVDFTSAMARFRRLMMVQSRRELTQEERNFIICMLPEVPARCVSRGGHYKTKYYLDIARDWFNLVSFVRGKVELAKFLPLYGCSGRPGYFRSFGFISAPILPTAPHDHGGATCYVRHPTVKDCGVDADEIVHLEDIPESVFTMHVSFLKLYSLIKKI